MTGARTAGHRDVLVAHGVPADTAQELVDDGLTVSVGGSIVLLSTFVDPVTGEHHALVTVGSDDVLADETTSAALLDHVRQHLPAADVVTLRTSSPGPHPAGATVRMRYVERSDPPSVDAPDGWEVRPYRASDARAVHELLVAALAAGAATSTGTWDRAAAVEVADDLLARVGEDVAVYCAVHDGTFAGHGTVVHERDDLTDRPQIELFDIYVTDEFRRSAAGRLLQAATIRHARGRGLPLRGHVVGGDEQADDVLERLLADGWRLAETYLSFPVRDVIP